MEIETISNYEENIEKSPKRTMDVDLQTNVISEKESNFSPNKVYEENSECSEAQGSEVIKEDKKVSESKILESESDDECEEEEEQELFLSPAHSDYGGEPLSPVNRDLLDSDCEGEKDGFVRSTEIIEDELSEAGTNDNCIQKESNVTKEDKTEINITQDESELINIRETDVDNKNVDGAAEVEPTLINEANEIDSNEDENEIDKDNCNKITNIETFPEEGDKAENEVKMDSPKNTESEVAQKESSETGDGVAEDTTNNEKMENTTEIAFDKPEKVDENADKLGDNHTVEEDNKEKGDDKKNADKLGDINTTDEDNKEKDDKKNVDKLGDINTTEEDKDDIKIADKLGDINRTEEDIKEKDDKKNADKLGDINTTEEDNKEKVDDKKNADKLGDINTAEAVNDEESKEVVEEETDKKNNLVDKVDEKKIDKVSEATNNEGIDKMEFSKEASEKVVKNKENIRKYGAAKKDKKKKTSNDVVKTNLEHHQNPNPSISEENKHGEEDVDMDDDFDPSLLMPELSMEVDEAPVITNNDAPAPEHEINKSPLQLYDPIFSTFVDEMTGAEVDFDLTAEELELKAKTYGEKNPVQLTKIHCTACNIHLGSALDGQGNRFVHPLLKVLICKKCFHFYTSGEFEKDEDGSELYCRWCGQGGQVLCCSSCEMVFCKKCIRINFDRRKLTEIQKSDDWMCFRCNPSQLIHLRIHCAEFMEYVQREMRLVGSAPNPEAYMNTDHCHCCLPQKKKQVEPTPSPVSQPKKRKRTTEDDPDYSPVQDRVDSPTPLSAVPSTSGPPTKMPVLTATTSNMSKPPQLRLVAPQQVNRSKVQVVNSAAVRPQSSFIRAPPVSTRLQAPTPALSTKPPVLRPLRPATTTKHEWFEKTVRSSARVNSNLSYTLTQLNRAQANATSVESLAVVHNKLQEILSSSINSLIQIRKNLRTEFIAGIKNIRFPPKNLPVSISPNTPPPLHPSVSSTKDDDDVIFIPSDPTPATVTSTIKAATITSTPKVTNTTTDYKGGSTVAQSSLRLPEVSILKRTSGSTSSNTTIPKVGPSGVARITPSKSINKVSSTTDVQPKGFLRVKSFSALQNVPAECITIPDDPTDDDIEPVLEKDPLGDIDNITDETSNHINGLSNGDQDKREVQKSSDKTAEKPAVVSIVEIPDDEETRPVKKPKIMLERSNEIDELVKNKFGLVNGDTD